VILVCDHRGGGLEEAARALAERGHSLALTRTLRQSLLRLQTDTPELVLIDPLSGAGEVELLALERARSGDEPPPVLVVAARDDEGALLRAARTLRLGTWDVVWRDAPPEELELRIERLLRQARLVREMGELRHRASHDDRTDLLRPQAFQARLVEHFSAAQRHRLDLALVLIDLDRFGANNQRHDHPVGDHLITQDGEVIRRAQRAEDVAGRLGGDEFAVVLPYTRKIDAARVVNRLRQEIARLSGLPPGAREPIQVSASLGFETFDGTDLESVEVLRRHAEEALRSAKESGGDQGVYFRRGQPEEPEEPERDGG
jgi:diguanylate cyclase (GGDEF)-like protein